jgi:hypothetical protein
MKFEDVIIYMYCKYFVRSDPSKILYRMFLLEFEARRPNVSEAAFNSMSLPSRVKFTHRDELRPRPQGNFTPEDKIHPSVHPKG